MGRYDKQFGWNSASLFIRRVCLSANIALLYVLFHFVAKARKNKKLGEKMLKKFEDLTIRDSKGLQVLWQREEKGWGQRGREKPPL